MRGLQRAHVVCGSERLFLSVPLFPLSLSLSS